MRAAFVPLVFVLAVSGSAQSVLLRYRPPVGKTFSYTLVTSTSITPPNSGKPMETNRTIAISLRVLAQGEGTTTQEMRIGPVAQDRSSDAFPASMPGRANVFQVTIDEFGLPREVAGTSATAAFLPSFGSAIGRGNQGVVFPEKPVDVGGTWTSDIDLGKVAPKLRPDTEVEGRLSLLFRLVALKDGVATVEVSGQGKMVTHLNGRDTNTTIATHATDLIDVATGMIRNATTTTDSTLEFPGYSAVRQHLASIVK